MYRYLLLLIPVLLMGSVPAKKTVCKSVRPGKNSPPLVFSRTVILDLNIPTGEKAVKQADFNKQNYKWLTTKVFPGILQKNDPVDNYIASAIKYYMAQPGYPTSKDLLAAGQKLQSQATDNPDFLMWLGYAYMINDDKKTARTCLDKAAKEMFKSEDTPACRKFLCGIFLSDAYDYRDGTSQKTAAATVKYLIEAMNKKEITDSESGFIFGVLGENRRSGRMFDMFMKYSGEIKQPDEWLIKTCLGYSEVAKAWKSRGSGWADSVTDDGWKGFKHHLGLAEKYLTAAWELRPDRPEAPAKMIAVAVGLGSASNQQDVLWFNRTVAAQVDYLAAYSSLLWYRRPRWCGSYDQMLQIGERALLSKHYDTAVPLFYFYALANIAGEIPFGNWRAAFRYPGFYERMERSCRKMLEQPHPPEELKMIQACQFWIFEFCGKYQLAADALDKLGGTLPVNYKNISYFRNVDFIASAEKRIKVEQALFSGPYKNQLENAEGLCVIGFNKAGTDEFIKVLEQLKDPEQRKYILKRIARALTEDNEEKAWNSDCGLHIAACKNDVQLVKQMLALGADVNEQDCNGRTPLHAALYNSEDKNDDDFTEIFELFLKNGADINSIDSSGFSVLAYAVSNNKEKVVDVLIAKGARLDTCSRNTWTPLTRAIYLKRAVIAEKIIMAGADVNAPKKSIGWTPLHYAAYVGNAKLVKLLIDKGAKTLIFDKQHQTPLHWAASKGNLESAEILLRNGIDINQRGGNTLTPLDCAIHCSSPERRMTMVKRFVELGADINKRDGSGWSPVYRCSMFDRPKELVFLLNKGADINLKDRREKTALDVAKTPEIKTILLAHNAKSGKELP